MTKRIEDYVRSLDLGAYVVGGAVRDELLGVDSKDADFLVPGVDIAGLRAALLERGYEELDDGKKARLVLNFIDRADPRPFRRVAKSTFGSPGVAASM